MSKYPNVYLIDQTKGNYSLDSNHIWGVHYVHFEKNIISILKINY